MKSFESFSCIRKNKSRHIITQINITFEIIVQEAYSYDKDNVKETNKNLFWRLFYFSCRITTFLRLQFLSTFIYINDISFQETSESSYERVKLKFIQSTTGEKLSEIHISHFMHVSWYTNVSQ